MFSFLKREKNTQEVVENVIGELKKIYRSKLLPLEEHYQFHDFHSPKLEDPDFDANPVILLVGLYSTGKTTFIRYLLERDFPGIRIGPEPTTDRFIAVMYDDKEGVIPGNALVVDPNKQFRPLSKYGNAFLNRFQCSSVASPVLNAISNVDTPGILSGEKQRIDRGYDFTGVLEWFAERVDRIILLFDAHKLDISDEFRRSIEALKGHDDKIRIILNKADMIDHQQLMRVYGALMWSLGKVLQDLLHLLDVGEVAGRNGVLALDAIVYLAEVLNQVLLLAVLAEHRGHVLAQLGNDEGMHLGQARPLDQIVQLAQGGVTRQGLQHQDFTKFHSLKPHLLDIVDNMLAKDIARLMEMIPQEEMTMVADPIVKGGAFEGVIDDHVSPFGYMKGEGIDAGYGEHEWICNKDKPRTDGIFNGLGPVDGKISGATAKQELIKSKLPNSVLSKIWKLSDVDGDGFLDSDEFALALHLINVKLEGCELPTVLPEHLVPPSKRYD
uniref:PAST-1 n=1 Tax=Drosophila melanogaster TaxID=7227 RepID=Q94919_DROME|nr:PAST-1 [Drosophila melanogaster]